MSSVITFSPENIQFIDYRKIEWLKVKRTSYVLHQRFHYRYPGPIRDLRQRLIVVPADLYGDQQLSEHTLKVTPVPTATHRTTDRFGNRVFELEVPRADGSGVTFEAMMRIERAAFSGDPPLISGETADLFLSPTRLTTADRNIAAAAHHLQDKSLTLHELAESISEWVYRAMRYGAGATDTHTTASEALVSGRGLCQDYAHLMLAMCREVRLPARYVSGHMLGEGGSHAWVEVLLPASEAAGELCFEAFAFDPTNQRCPDLRYITVATGRDYSDVAPTSGRFTAPYPGHLMFSKKAGLTFVEYFDGQVISSL